MRRISCFFMIILMLVSCKKEREINNFTEITHYFIGSEIGNKNDTIKRFNEIFSSVYGHKINFQTFENELISYGYNKNIKSAKKIRKIDEFITNDIYYESHLTACIPSYRDVLILKKNNKIVNVLKLCFECGMIDKYGGLKSNCEKVVDFETYFLNFADFYKTLHGTTYESEY